MCPCWQNAHPSVTLYEAVELTPRQIVYKSTLAENTLSVLVCVSPGSICTSEIYCRQSCIYEYHSIIESVQLQYMHSTFGISQSAIIRMFSMCLLTKLFALKQMGAQVIK